MFVCSLGFPLKTNSPVSVYRPTGGGRDLYLLPDVSVPNFCKPQGERGYPQNRGEVIFMQEEKVRKRAAIVGVKKSHAEVLSVEIDPCIVSSSYTRASDSDCQKPRVQCIPTEPAIPFGEHGSRSYEHMGRHGIQRDNFLPSETNRSLYPLIQQSVSLQPAPQAL